MTIIRKRDRDFERDLFANGDFASQDDPTDVDEFREAFGIETYDFDLAQEGDPSEGVGTIYNTLITTYPSRRWNGGMD